MTDAPVPALFVTPRQAAETDERFTPRWIFDALGLYFDLDPASPVEGGDCVPARERYTKLDDGLSLPWHGLVWLNPPYANATPWADRFRAHGCGVFLGPIANSRWFVDLLDAVDLAWLCRDLKFTHPTHSGRHASMPLFFVAMGDEACAGLRRLACSGVHRGVLVQRAGTIPVRTFNDHLR